jgi:hypothetical protein
MKKQFLHEAHNLQDKGKKTDYQEQLRDEGDNFDRGGASRGATLGSFKIRGCAVYIDLKPLLNDDKQSLLQTLDRHLKFNVDGNVGTISQLLKNPKLAQYVKERHEMTRRSVLRADTFYIGQHPKKNRQTRIVEVNCFLQPAEPFTNPIPKDCFAFSLNVVTPQP